MTAYAKAGLVLAMLLIGFACGWLSQGWRKDSVMGAYVAKQAAAYIQMEGQNAIIIAKQAVYNEDITKVKNEENARTIASLNQRLRRGAGICAAPSAASTESAGSSNDSDTGARFFREDIQRDFAAAIKASEDSAATARACQAFVRDNGMAQ